MDAVHWCIPLRHDCLPRPLSPARDSRQGAFHGTRGGHQCEDEGTGNQNSRLYNPEEVEEQDNAVHNWCALHRLVCLSDALPHSGPPPLPPICKLARGGTSGGVEHEIEVQSLLGCL